MSRPAVELRWAQGPSRMMPAFWASASWRAMVMLGEPEREKARWKRP